MRKRWRRLWNVLGCNVVDAIILHSRELIRYLTGFTGSESIFVLGKSKKFLLVDSRYTEQARKECENVEIVECVNKMEKAVRMLVDCGFKKIGYNPRQLTVWEKALFDAKGIFNMIELPEAVESVRAIKDNGELSRMRMAATIASSSFLEVINKVKPGLRENEVAFELEFAIRSRGAEAVPFPVIVASGLRGALPHGLASEKKIMKGDFVTIDFGAIYKGYCSDETCTVVMGKPGTRQKKVYQTVKEAHDRAIGAVKQGVKSGRIDAVARSVVEKAGLGKYFRHGTGHGVGLAVHEEPRIAPRQDAILESDMVFTIEPGIYISGWGGVRIEDMVRVTNDGCEVLSSVNKELLYL